MTEATYQIWSLIITGAGVVVGIAVVIIYGKQLTAMRGQLAEIKAAGAATEKQIELATSARLHIEGVRVADFSSGLEPVFFVKIVDSGPVAAEDVAVNIRVEGSEGGRSIQAASTESLSRRMTDGNISSSGHRGSTTRLSMVSKAISRCALAVISSTKESVRSIATGTTRGRARGRPACRSSFRAISIRGAQFSSRERPQEVPSRWPRP